MYNACIGNYTDQTRTLTLICLNLNAMGIEQPIKMLKRVLTERSTQIFPS